MSSRTLSSFVLLFCIFCLLPFAALHAQTPATVSGVGLKPATIEENADPGTTQDHSVSITNLSGTKQTYYLYTRDITSVREGGVPVFANENTEKTGYELTQWMSLNKDHVTLAPGEQTSVNIHLDIPENATPGSHFASVLVSLVPPKMRSMGASVGYEVADIISIRIAGDAVENAQIRSFSTSNFIYGKPKIDFHATVENKGTVLVRPLGPLEIYNMFGKRVGLLTFNEKKSGVFPMSSRDFVATWNGDGPGFGRYQAVLALVYGEQGRQSTISSTVSFWILPMNIIAPAIGVLVALLLVAYILIRLYIRRTLRTASMGSRRIVRRRRSSGISALLLATVVMLAVTALFLLVLLALFA